MHHIKILVLLLAPVINTAVVEWTNTYNTEIQSITTVILNG